MNPFLPIIQHNGVVILDGGLATELEKKGFDLDHPLWSAKVLLEDPGAIKDVHKAYLDSGSNCIITSSYQVSFEGCMELGMSEIQTEDLLKLSVKLAWQAVEETENEYPDLGKPLVAASIGPYGAYLADGSEYTGNYDIGREELLQFHGKRWDVLSNTDVDLLACETIPSLSEAEVLIELLSKSPETFAYFSFACRDGKHINDSTPIRTVAKMLDDFDTVAAIGINCTAPNFITSLIEEIKETSNEKPIIIYPNSGERYDGNARKWGGEHNPCDLAEMAVEWRDLGAQIIGGCWRTGPELISELKKRII